MKTQKSLLAKADKAAEAERQTISPPDGWALQSPFGYMRYDATPAGLLVRVAEVLRWLEKAHPLPRVAALKAMCEAMPPDVVNSLFWLRHNDYAKAVPGSFRWGFATAAQIEAKRKADTANRIFRDLKRKRDYPNADIVFVTPKIKPTPCATEPGLPALLKILGKYWKQSPRTSTCDILDDPAISVLSTLAVPLAKAAELWGYGQILRAVDSEPSTFVDLVKLRKSKPRSTWTETERKILKTEVDKRINQPGHRKDIAAALQMTPTRIGQLIDPNWQSKRRPAANLRSVRA